MKNKFYIFFLSLLVSFLFIGCSASSTNNETNEDVIYEQSQDPIETDEAEVSDEVAEIKDDKGKEFEIDLTDVSDENKALIEDVLLIKDTIMDDKVVIDREIDGRPYNQLAIDIKDGKCDRTQTLLRLREIISSVDISHLYLYAVNDDMEVYTVYLPLFLYEFDEGYYITSCDAKYKDYLGSKLISINGYNTEELIEMMDRLFSFETVGGKQSVLYKNLWKCYTDYLGITKPEDETVTYKVLDLEGNEVEFEADFISPLDVNPKYLLEEDEKPFYFRNLDNRYYDYDFESNEENTTMFYTYYSCFEVEDYTFNQCLTQMLDEMEEKGTYKNIVFDIRKNGGGNSQVAYWPLYENQERLNKYNIIVCFDNYTYSAALNFIDNCISLFDNVKLYGCQTGQKVDNYTEVRNISLKCGWVVGYPTECAYYQNLIKRASDRQLGVIPDVEVYSTFEDYILGKDTVYEKILSDYGK